MYGKKIFSGCRKSPLGLSDRRDCTPLRALLGRRRHPIRTLVGLKVLSATNMPRQIMIKILFAAAAANSARLWAICFSAVTDGSPEKKGRQIGTNVL